ncbi:MAG: hypothetical protein GTN69_10610 [Armatimonadetes bacterium]|nr:hypothetical protein [Armatimonadota bacterium]
MTQPVDGWIQLHGGCYYDFNEPSLDHVTLDSIAHHLAYSCRFNGGTRRLYSVAEHSIWVMRSIQIPDCSSRAVSGGFIFDDTGRRVKRAALMHDSHEAIVCDIPRPLRKMAACAELNAEIAKVRALFRERWPGDYDHPAIVQADLALLHTEKVQLLHPEPRPWPDMPPPLDIRLECWRPEEAKSRFLHECRRLGIE